MTELELNPCPFCNCHNVKLTKHYKGGIIYRAYIECGNCGAEVSYGIDLESVIKIWNRRG